MFTLLTLLCTSLLPIGNGQHEAAGIVPPSAAYLGQELPGEKPERFAPNILLDHPFLEAHAFSPDWVSANAFEKNHLH